MSTEVELSTADTLTSLQSQLASAHEQLAIAEATVTLWRDAGVTLLDGASPELRAGALGAMKQLLRDKEAGAGELARVRALATQGKKLADAVQAYFNKLGTKTIDQRPERYEIYEMAEALADYGILEQQVKARIG